MSGPSLHVKPLADHVALTVTTGKNESYVYLEMSLPQAEHFLVQLNNAVCMAKGFRAGSKSFADWIA